VVIGYFGLQKRFDKVRYGAPFIIALIVYMGLRPIDSFYFGDMSVYSGYFKSYQEGGEGFAETKDVYFMYFMKFCSGIMSVEMFFLTCAFLYVFPLYVVCKKWFPMYWFYAFLFVVASFSFWAYGTNGIRNGLATSFFLLGISRDRRVLQVIWIFLATGIHSSLLLPTVGFAIAQFFNKPKVMIAFWTLCIPFSLASGGYWESLFSTLGFDDDRISYLTEDVNKNDFSSTGFRWDFLLYSSTAVFAGWYFIVKKGFNDKVYFWLFNTYVFANAFWILVIRANFSNRFAYLSWFMMALVIVYPLLKQKLVLNQNKVLANILVVYFSFTFLMNVILAKQ
jgi:hypothetical protein